MQSVQASEATKIREKQPIGRLRMLFFALSFLVVIGFVALCVTQRSLHLRRIAELKSRVDASEARVNAYGDGYSQIYKSAQGVAQAANDFTRKLTAVENEPSLAVALDRLRTFEKKKAENDETLQKILQANFKSYDGNRYDVDTKSFLITSADLRDQLIGLDALLANAEANPLVAYGTTYGDGVRAGRSIRIYVDADSELLRKYSALSGDSAASRVAAENRKQHAAYDTAAAKPFLSWLLSP